MKIGDKMLKEESACNLFGESTEESLGVDEFERFLFWESVGVFAPSSILENNAQTTSSVKILYLQFNFPLSCKSEWWSFVLR